MDIVDTIAVIIAQYFPYVVVLGAFLFILREKEWKQQLFRLIFIALSVIAARGVFVEVIRLFYHRPRPFIALEFTPLIEASGWAFPSGHATFFFALAFAVFYFNKQWGWRFLVFAALIGIARVFVGVHWVSDIIGGIAVGFLGFGVAYFLLRKTFAHLTERG